MSAPGAKFVYAGTWRSTDSEPVRVRIWFEREDGVAICVDYIDHAFAGVEVSPKRAHRIDAVPAGFEASADLSSERGNPLTHEARAHATALLNSVVFTPKATVMLEIKS